MYLVHPVLLHPSSLSWLNERKHKPLSVVSKMKRNMKHNEEGLSPPRHVQNKKKGNEKGGTPPCHSQNKREWKETQWGEVFPLLVMFVIFARSMGSSRGKWEGCAAGSSSWGGMRCQILKENKKRVHLVHLLPLSHPFPSVPFHVVVVRHLCLAALLVVVEGGWG